MTLTVSSDALPLVVRWTRVDTGLWVAARGGAHLGRVESLAPRRFAAYSGSGRPLGEFDALAPARTVVEASA